MNTLELAKIANKRHDHVVRDILKRFPDIEWTYIVGPTKRKTKVLILSDEQLSSVSYGKESLSEILKKKDKHIKELEEIVRIKERKIEQLKDALMTKDNTIANTYADNEALTKRNKELMDHYEIARISVANAKHAMLINYSNPVDIFLRMERATNNSGGTNATTNDGVVTKKDLLKLKGMVHPDKLTIDSNAPFIFINGLMNSM